MERKLHQNYIFYANFITAYFYDTVVKLHQNYIFYANFITAYFYDTVVNTNDIKHVKCNISCSCPCTLISYSDCIYFTQNFFYFNKTKMNTWGRRWF